MFSRMKKYWWRILCSILLIAFTTYVLADTFLISKVYTVVENETEKERSNEKNQEKAETTKTSYSDENIQIKVTEYRENDTTIHVADITLQQNI